LVHKPNFWIKVEAHGFFTYGGDCKVDADERKLPIGEAKESKIRS
jgi:hypothetical protein